MLGGQIHIAVICENELVRFVGARKQNRVQSHLEVAIMSTNNLEDVRSAIATGQKAYFGALKVYVTGFEADVDFPRKFLYRGCHKDNGFGFYCCKSLERGPCRDHPSGEAWAYMYRFDLYLVDGTISSSSPPLRVTIFDAAASLIGMSPTKFNDLTELSQFERVHAATQKLTMLYVYLSVNPGKDTFPIVEGLSHDKDAQSGSSRSPIPVPRPGALSFRSPRRGVTPIQSQGTPSKEEQTSTSESSTSKNDIVKKLLYELMDALGHTNLGEQ